jgi:hypothetical protein
LSNLGGRPEGQAYDNVRHTLYVARERGSDNGAILAFDNADLSTTTGNATPARVIQGSGAALRSPFDLFFDSVHDRLFLADIGLGQILVYDNASTLTNSSNPSRIISGGSDFSVSNPPISLYVDVARDILYVVPNLGLNLLVFDGASTRNDGLGANRRITPSTSVYQLADVKIDTTNDLAYCTNLGGNSILVFSSASAANGLRAPVAALAMSLSAGEQPQASFQDTSNDRLFVTVADRTPGVPSGRVLVFDRLSTLTGAVSPARIITGFTAPSGLTGFYR